eukprot:TRINITY_DN18253_c0_g1_i1.p1 TRINITY_DN18253_c0_g1~~TRINITY_DN18253_c0_g1_i1.p1  ORF type:complete len:170 (+),score=22.78 TRINITY_DN18253_c0_g1_i1:139-648(+)
MCIRDRLQWMQTAFFALPYVLGWAEQRQSFDLELIDSSLNPWATPAVQAVLSIDQPGLRVYSALLHFHIRLHGLRFFMWRYFWTTAFSCTFFLAFCLMSMFGVAYLTLSGGPQDDAPNPISPQSSMNAPRGSQELSMSESVRLGSTKDKSKSELRRRANPSSQSESLLD